MISPLSCPALPALALGNTTPTSIYLATGTMAGPSKQQSPKFPSVSVVVPRMSTDSPASASAAAPSATPKEAPKPQSHAPQDHVPSPVVGNMSSTVTAGTGPGTNSTIQASAQPNSNTPAAQASNPTPNLHSGAGANGSAGAAAAVVPGGDSMDDSPEANELRDSEMQLVSSLAKLQKLEASIHHLRTLLPDRLLDPLAPLLDPKGTNRLAPDPLTLRNQLHQSMRKGAQEVTDFQSTWRSPDLSSVWGKVDADIKDNGGTLLQPSGMWERDYDVLLEGLMEDEKRRREIRERADEEGEKDRILKSEGGWRGVVAAFEGRKVPGVRAIAGRDGEDAVTVVLGRSGMVLRVVGAGEGDGLPEWTVESKTGPGSKLESAVLECLNACPRRWDLRYLLDMISSYSDFKQTPCVKCGKTTDSAIQLPTLRRPKQTPSADGQSSTVWEAYHPSCA